MSHSALGLAATASWGGEKLRTVGSLCCCLRTGIDNMDLMWQNILDDIIGISAEMYGVEIGCYIERSTIH